MRRTLFSLVIVMTLGGIPLVAAGQALAGPAIEVSGTYSVSDIGSTTCTPVGSSGFLFRCDTTGLVSEYTGALTGRAVADFTALIDCQTGRETGHGAETFTGSIVGLGSGALTWTDQFSSDVDCGSFFPFNLDIKSVAVKGSGGLGGLQGKLQFTDTTYSGSLQ